MDHELYERIHACLNKNGGSVSAALKELGEGWTFRRLVATITSREYRDWQLQLRDVLMAHAEHTAMRKVAFNDNLSDQAQAQIAVAILSGKTDEAKKKASRAREERQDAAVVTQTEDSIIGALDEEDGGQPGPDAGDDPIE